MDPNYQYRKNNLKMGTGFGAHFAGWSQIGYGWMVVQSSHKKLNTEKEMNRTWKPALLGSILVLFPGLVLHGFSMFGNNIEKKQHLPKSGLMVMTPMVQSVKNKNNKNKSQ